MVRGTPGSPQHAVLKRHVLRLFRGLHRFTALVEVHAGLPSRVEHGLRGDTGSALRRAEVRKERSEQREHEGREHAHEEVLIPPQPRVRNDPWFERIDAQPPVLARERQRRREDRLLRRRVRIAPASFEPPGFHSPRALASTERNRPPRKPAIAAGLRSGSSTADATFTTSAPSRRCGNNSSVNKNVPKWFVANVESHPTEFCGSASRRHC